MFRGIFESTIDSKGRSSLPAKFREVLTDSFADERFFITNSYPVEMEEGTQCSGLMIIPYQEWFRFEENFLNSKGLTPVQRNNILYSIVSPAQECTADKLGRILLPPNHRKTAGLDRDIVYVGALKRAEIWNASEWERVRIQAMKNFPTTTEAAAEFGL
ncbi:MAG: cell division/cell wall cluster transcriptional repressor MraZ [Geobacteraceae bacterium GWC2_48_7]|nr:MAG: cell division/cell wall cluster transcriptional repressor MraZ [Geobacteraceae bacterium GWC2_48_7]